MIKIKYIIFLFIIFLFLSGCTVNENTGLIIIVNLTDVEIKNIKIGTKTLSYSLSEGIKYDYWFYSKIDGKISADGVEEYEYYDDDENEIIRDPDLEFEVDKEYLIEIVEDDGDYEFRISKGKEIGEDEDSFEHPAKT